MSMKKRVNMSLDADILTWLDGVAERYGCNRSECVELIVELCDELELVSKLESYYVRANGEQDYVSKRHLVRAARNAYIIDNEAAWR